MGRWGETSHSSEQGEVRISSGKKHGREANGNIKEGKTDGNRDCSHHTGTSGAKEKDEMFKLRLDSWKQVKMRTLHCVFYYLVVLFLLDFFEVLVLTLKNNFIDLIVIMMALDSMKVQEMYH